MSWLVWSLTASFSGSREAIALNLWLIEPCSAIRGNGMKSGGGGIELRKGADINLGVWKLARNCDLLFIYKAKCMKAIMNIKICA